MRQNLAPLAPPSQPTPITEQVLITTHDIALGTVLNPDDLREMQYPVEYAPRTAVVSLSEVVGRIAKVPIGAGEVVMAHHLADPTNVNHDLAFTIGDDQVLLAFPASDLMSTLNVLQRGDVVDIFVSLQQAVPSNATGVSGLTEEDETVTLLFTFDALQKVQITALVVDILNEQQSRFPTDALSEDTVAPTPQPSDVKVRAYLLALDPQDALVLKHLKDAGAIFDLVLRAPTSTELFEVYPVNSEYLIDKYGLEDTP
jgi:Flp pilus assembly protein CpaB